MSEVIIFTVGSILFILTTGATVSFGLFRAHELQIRDMKDSPRIAEIEELGLTELYRTQPVDEQSSGTVQGS